MGQINAPGEDNVRLGSFSTQQARPAYLSMSVSPPKQPNDLAWAKCREGPTPDSCDAAKIRLYSITSLRAGLRRAAIMRASSVPRP